MISTEGLDYHCALQRPLVFSVLPKTKNNNNSEIVQLKRTLLSNVLHLQF